MKRGLSPAALCGALAALFTVPALAAVPQPEAYCFAVADSGDDLIFISKDGDSFLNQGGTGTGDMEAIAFNPEVSSCGTVATPRNIEGCLYAINGDDFGFLDYDDSWDGDGNDSEFIQVSTDVGTCTLPGGATVTINDIDGLQFDYTRTDPGTGTLVLWASARDGDGGAPDDVLFQINPTTGLVDTTPTPGFTGGATCVRVSGPGLLVDIDDVAIDPTDGTIYAVNNTGGNIDLLVTVDPVTGAGTIIGNFFNPLLQVEDMEGLSFGLDGQLYGTTGTSNEFFRIGNDTAFSIAIVDFNDFSGLGDYEAVTCLTDNLITGTVFFDIDGDGTLEPIDGDAGFGGARVLIYIDNNNDGLVDGGDTLLCDNPGGGFNLDCPVTRPDGFYDFTLGQGNFVAEVDTTTLPGGHSLSTDNIEEADFGATDFGEIDPDNDFGFTIPAGGGGLDVTKTSDAGGPVVQGQTITYTIEVTNNTGATNTNLRLTDTLPAGVTYDPQSTMVTGPVSQLFQARDEFETVSYGNDDGRDSWAGPWIENDLDAAAPTPPNPSDPTSGEVQVVGGSLRLDNNISAANLPFVDRQVDISAYAGAGAVLRYQYRLSSGVDTGDEVVVEASTGGPFTVIDTITGQSGPGLAVRTVNLADFISATTTIRFRITVDYNTTANNEFFFVDFAEVLAGENYRDELDTEAVNRQDGSLNWTTNWLEIGEADGPGNGDIRIGRGDGARDVMQIRQNDGGNRQGWQRQADLSTAEQAILSFLYRRDGLDDATEYVTIDVSDDGGASWTELARLDGANTGGDDVEYVPAALDISAFASPNTRVRFLGSPDLDGDRVYFDDINILAPRLATVTKDNVPAGVNRDLVDGVPPVLVETDDEYLLPDGSTITVTLRVVVDNPLDPYRPSLLNSVVVTSDQSAGSAQHVDPVISGAIGDRVWLDTDGDGVQDIGEVGISNVQVSLRVDDDGTPGPSAGDSVYDTRITGADGDYLFAYLPPEDYWVDVTDATVPAGLVQSPGNIDPPTDPIGSALLYAIATDDVYLTADFGYTAPGGTALIGDYVWNDIDRDGIQDPTEVGLGDVTLELRSAGPDGVFGTGDDVVEDTTTTAADGSYLFTGVAAGEYIVVVTDTGNELNGFAPTVGPQSEGSSVSAPVTVAGGDVVDDVDFGYAPAACLPRIDFETDALGNPLVAGQIIDDEWAEWGITASFTVNAPSTGPLMIFDSANPTGGDVDLGSPNETCAPPGPGIGTEGEVGQPGENCFPQGNLLIISEDGDGSDPDDAADGGTIVFSFADELEIDALSFLDSENNQDSVEVLAAPVDDYADQFDATSFINSDGALDWTGEAWDEVGTDDGTAGGGAVTINVTAGELQLEGTGGNPERRIERDVDLTGFAAARLSFDWRCVGDMEDASGGAAADFVHIEISADGGTGWTTLETKEGNVDMCLEPGDNDAGSEVYDLAALLDADPSDSRIRFRYTISAADEDFFVDNLAVRPTLFFSNLASPGDNAFERLPVGVSGARELRITFPASGALAGIDFCLASLRDKVWLDANEDGLFQPSEMGIPGVTVSLLSDPDGVPNNGDEVVVATTTTDANGNFGFDGLDDGDYLIQITDTGGELNDLGGTTAPGIARELAVSVVDGEDVVGINFGYNAAGTLGDRIWSDVDGDGVQDAGEPGIGGVLVNLLDGLGAPVLDAANNPITATTAADGSYLFSGLVPGDYIVEVDAGNFVGGQPLAGYTQTGFPPTVPATCSAGADCGASTLGFGGSDLTLDFGYQATSAAVYPISGTVFEDADEDGFFDDPGESTFAGVTVELRDDLGNVIATTTTDASGNYLFADQPNGDYTVAVTDTAGILDGYRLTSGLDAIDVTVLDAPVTDIDFGYVRDPGTASIGDTVWFDADGDGLPGPTEPGIPNVALDLYQDDGDGVLEPTVEVLDGRIDLDGDGDVDGFDDGEIAGLRIIDGRLDLDGDGFITGADDGTFNGATVIDGEIDLNGSGGVDGTDDGTLVGDDGLPVATTLTDGNGQYIFPDLAAGAYFVDVRESTVPDSTADGTPDLVETGYPGVDPADAITLSEGECYVDADFGYLPRPGTAAFGDGVWHDTDGDGVQDDGELGIPGVDIIVSAPGGDTTITTAADGFEMATGLTGGGTLYSVNYDAGTVPGLTQTFPGDVSYQVTVDDGDLFSHLDYGFTGGAYGSIGSLVWLDIVPDGVWDEDGADDILGTADDEPPIEGVTISLIADTNGDGVWDPAGADGIFGTADDEPILETSTTDAAGSYLFTGVPLGADYLVDVSDIGGVLAGLQKTSGTSDADNNSQDDPYDVAMPGVPTAILTGDFGYTPVGGFGSIGNKVWHDLDGDGFRDDGEPGIQGVTIELWLDVDGDGVLMPGVDNLVRNATTDISGEYEFNSLPLGDYLVNVTDDNGVLDDFVKTSGTGTVDDNSQANPYTVTLDAGNSDNVTADFGYWADPINAVLTIAGTVFEDEDDNALFDDGGEPEIEGATVFLFRDLDGDGVLDPTDPVIGSTLTDVNGDYLFTNLPPGDYLLAVDVDGTPVDDYLQTTQAATGGVQPVSLPTSFPPDPGAPNSTGNDFGFWNGGTVNNPITLAWLRVEEVGAGVRVEWMTATETGNVGFNLYAVGKAGLRRLNDELIPSRVIDSLEPQRYELEAEDAVERTFLLEDIDLFGGRRYHGPFERGESRGAEPQQDRIPWQEIRAERAVRRAGLAGTRSASGSSAASSWWPGPTGGPSPNGWPAARLEVGEDGVYRVSYEQLLAAGIDLNGAAAASLALLERGEPVPMRVESGRRFGPGSFIEFVGEGLKTLYAKANVYTLAVRPGKALRVERNDSPASTRAPTPPHYRERLAVNRDSRYILTAPGDDPWYEDHLLAYGAPASREFEVEVDGYAGGPAALEIDLWGLSAFPKDPDHHVEIEWNGSTIGNESFDDRVVHRVEAELLSGAVVDGTNRLGLTLANEGGVAWDMVALDRLWLTYARRFVPRHGRLRFEAVAPAFAVSGLTTFDVVVYRIEKDRPVLLGGLEAYQGGDGLWVRFAGAREAATYYLAEVGALRLPAISVAPSPQPMPGPSRLLVISHGDFLQGIQPLIDARRAEGWTVGLIDVEEAYRRESGGVVDPMALRRTIQWAHRERGTEAVLLVGGDTYDYHDNLGLGSISFVPSLYTATDAIVRFAPVDPLYGDVDDDGVPDVAVGRLPVRTPEELISVVTRILEYGDSPFAGTALLAADADDVPAGYSFTVASDQLAAMLPAGWDLERVYMDELSRTDARERLIGGINAGVGLTSYFGHSGTTAWSFDNLFNVNDAAELDNPGRPTVVTQFGCWNNYHVTPTYNTLGHKLLLSGDRGAAAVLGAATLTQATSEQKLGRRLFARLGWPGATLGGALLAAERDLAATDPDLVDVILGWTLLGDPSLRMDQ